MTEFQTMMQEAARMCGEHDECGNCPLREMVDMADIYCPIPIMRQLDTAKVEAAVMVWAAAHPEPRYPTWTEWHKANFPDSNYAICPNYFTSKRPLGTCAVSCEKCTNTPIPADIAEKLGIKPIGGNEND